MHYKQFTLFSDLTKVLVLFLNYKNTTLDLLIRH